MTACCYLVACKETVNSDIFQSEPIDPFRLSSHLLYQTHWFMKSALSRWWPFKYYSHSDKPFSSLCCSIHAYQTVQMVRLVKPSHPLAQVPLMRCNFRTVYGLKTFFMIRTNPTDLQTVSFPRSRDLLSPLNEMQFSHRIRTENSLLGSVKEKRPKSCFVEPYQFVYTGWPSLGPNRVYFGETCWHPSVSDYGVVPWEVVDEHRLVWL